MRKLLLFLLLSVAAVGQNVTAEKVTSDVYQTQQVLPNDSSTGTLVNGLATSVGGKIITTTAGANAGVIGVCIQYCGTASTPLPILVVSGTVQLNLDNTGVPSDYVCISASTNGYGTDCGLNPSSGQVVGVVNSFVSGTLYSVQINISPPNPSSVLNNGIINNPGINQTVQPISNGITPLTLKCPAGASGSLNAFNIIDQSGNPLLSLTCGATFTIGNGLGVLTSGASGFGICTVTFSTTPVFNAAACNTFKMTLTGDVVSSTLTNMLSSSYQQNLTFYICQDATGGRTFAGWPTQMKGVNSRTVGKVASTCSEIDFKTDGTNARYIKGIVNQL